MNMYHDADRALLDPMETASVDALRQHQLERLISRNLALHLPRQAGQREDRYTHALGDPAEIEAILAARQQESGQRSSGSSVSEERIEALEARIAALEARLADLEG